jgi:hypothetical protein
MYCPLFHANEVKIEYTEPLVAVSLVCVRVLYACVCVSEREIGVRTAMRITVVVLGVMSDASRFVSLS